MATKPPDSTRGKGKYPPITLTCAECQQPFEYQPWRADERMRPKYCPEHRNAPARRYRREHARDFAAINKKAHDARSKRVELEKGTLEPGKVDVVQRELAARELASRHLIAFTARQEPSYLAGWFHKDLARRLERFYKAVKEKKSPRLMIQCPPRSGKSLLTSQMFPAWVLGQDPTMEIIACSYSASLAMDFSRKTREMLRSDTYRAVFPRTVLSKEDQNAEGWRTTQGGGYLPAGVGGPITGKGAHCLLVDDPIKNMEEAESQITRSAIKNWYQSTAYTRLAPGGGVIVIQTRWHLDDLSGWLEAQARAGEGEEWEIVRYPMIATEDERYRLKGEALHPERYDEIAAERIRRSVGPRVWSALYQQNPMADTGQYFKEEMFKLYTPPEPPGMPVYATFDLAIGKQERNDYTVGVVAGIDHEDNIWILDVVRGHWNAHEITEQILAVQRSYAPEEIGLEKGQIQLAIGPYLQQRIQEERLYALNLVELPTGRRDKLSRARTIQGWMTQGRVKFPRGAPWLEVLMQEMLSFPDGRNDDIVDAMAHLGLRLETAIVPHADNKLVREWGWRQQLHRWTGKLRGNKTFMST